MDGGNFGQNIFFSLPPPKNGECRVSKRFNMRNTLLSNFDFSSTKNVQVDVSDTKISGILARLLLLVSRADIFLVGTATSVRG